MNAEIIHKLFLSEDISQVRLAVCASGPEPLEIACDLDSLELLLAMQLHGADVASAVRDAGLLSMAKSAKVASFLLTHADLKTINSAQYLTLATAARLGRRDVVEVLLDAGADPDVASTGFSADTALHKAAWNLDLALVRLLIERGANLDAKQDRHWTALHVCMRGEGREDERRAVAAALMAGGADVNARADGGHTPLHFACEYGHTQLMRDLIADGADVDAKTRHDEYTALGMCCIKRNLEPAIVLLRAGASDVGGFKRDEKAKEFLALAKKELARRNLSEEVASEIEGQLSAAKVGSNAGAKRRGLSL